MIAVVFSIMPSVFGENNVAENIWTAAISEDCLLWILDEI
jgi:hypothetical protein